MNGHRGRGHQEHQPDYEPCPITIDHTLAMAEVVGAANGLSPAELSALEPRLQQVEALIQTWRQDGTAGFCALPYDRTLAPEIKALAKQLKEWCRDALVVGLGGAAIGVRALRQALLHPSHNFFPLGRRQYHSRLFLADNIEPDSLYGMLDSLELKRLAVNVISLSGETPETLALFLFIYQILANRLGAAQAKESCVLTTAAGKGGLRRLADKEGFPLLTVPTGVHGGFGILSAMGLFPAALAGIDINGLLAGARFMDQRLQDAPLRENPAYQLAACYYLASQAKGRPVHLILPYADSLLGLADWWVHLWSTSLGKQYDREGRRVNAGITTVRGRGAADQHTLLPYALEGPNTMVVTFLEVESFQHQITVPPALPGAEDLTYLHGRTFGQLLAADKQAAAGLLAESGRPSLTIRLPAVNAFTIGQLIHLLQMTTLILGGLLGIDPMSQPRLAEIRRTTGGLLGEG